ncbi:MAG: tetratricopeptide repeat protein [Cyclobacteriaceae bacterium]
MRSCILILLGLFVGSLAYAQSRGELAQEQYDNALSAYRNKEYSQAQEHLGESLRLFPTDKAYYLQGLVYQMRDKNLRAVSSFESVLALNPSFAEAKFQKALIYLKYGDAEKAVEDLTSLISQHGNNTTRSVLFQVDETGNGQNRIMTASGMKGNYYYHRAKAYQKLEAYELALADFETSLFLDSQANTLVARALLYMELDSLILARKDLTKAIEISPDHYLAWYNLALIDPNAQVPPELLNQDGFAPIISLLASRAVEKEDYGLALLYFEKSLANDSTDALTLINRGRILIKVAQYAQARQDFLTAKQLDFTRVECWYLIANTYFYEQNFENALAYYDQYLAYDYSSGMVWHNAAVCHLELGQSDEACHYLSQSSKHGMSRAEDLMAKYCQDD